MSPRDGPHGNEIRPSTAFALLLSSHGGRARVSASPPHSPRRHKPPPSSHLRSGEVGSKGTVQSAHGWEGPDRGIASLPPPLAQLSRRGNRSHRDTGSPAARLPNAQRTGTPTADRPVRKAGPSSPHLPGGGTSSKGTVQPAHGCDGPDRGIGCLPPPPAQLSRRGNRSHRDTGSPAARFPDAQRTGTPTAGPPVRKAGLLSPPTRRGNRLQRDGAVCARVGGTRQGHWLPPSSPGTTFPQGQSESPGRWESCRPLS